MHAHFDAERDDTKVDERLAPNSPQTPAWQFSLRTLLIVTAFISVCLAIGVHFAGVMFALAFAAVVQALMLLSADWLIRPQNRRALAFVTAGSWLLLGSGLLIVGIREILMRIGIDSGAAGWVFAWSMAGLGLYCYYIAAKRWRRLTSQQPANI